MLNGKAVMLLLIVEYIKKTLCKMSQYYPKPYEHCGGNVKVELDLSDYATKNDLKVAAGVHAPMLASKSDLASLRAEVDKIAVDKLKTAS